MRQPAELEHDVLDYIGGVRSGAVVAGRLVQLAVERHVRDLAYCAAHEDGGPRRLRFNRVRALGVCWWIEHRLRFSKGQWAGRPFILSPWQLFIVWCLFGWERRISEEPSAPWRRRFRTAYVSTARKNGKTEFAAALALVFLVVPGECEAGGEAYSAATKRDQASICWNAAAGMVRRSPLVKREITIHKSVHNMVHVGNESKFETVSSDADTLDGLGPLLGIVDEYHAHPDSSVFDVIESGMGARAEPLMFVITTAGGKRAGACWNLETDAVKVLEGIGESEGSGDDLFAFIARIDDGDDPFDEACWPKSNPNLGVSCHLDFLRTAARVARRRPDAMGEYLRKHMNRWTEVSTAWLPMPIWDGCGDVTPWSAEREKDGLLGERCFVGIDLSAVNDYTAGAAVFPPSEKRPFWDVVLSCWIPEATLVERGRVDRVPVMQWVDAGLVTPTAGDVVDQDAVKLWVLGLRDRYDVAGVPMDPHNATKLQSELMALGFRVVNWRQGWVTMSPAIKQTEILLRKKLIRHGGNPVLRWMFSNVALKRDSNDNVSLSKSRSGDRIDGIVSLVMGVGFASLQKSEPEKRSVYESRGLLTV